MKIRNWLIGAAAALASALALAAVDVNQATEAELDGIKGIGPATTRLIMDERKSAPFADWHDLNKRVKGIGPKRAAKLSKEGLVVNGKPFAEGDAAAAAPAAPRPRKTEGKAEGKAESK